MAASFGNMGILPVPKNRYPYSVWSTLKRHFNIHCTKNQKNKVPKSGRRTDLVDLDGLFPPRRTRPAKPNSKKDPQSQTRSAAEDRASKKARNAETSATLSFKQLLNQRYEEACRSVVIRTENPERTVQSLASFGNINYAQFTAQDKSYLLAEFRNAYSVHKLQNTAGFFRETNQFPMSSRIFCDTHARATAKQKKGLAHKSIIEDKFWGDKSSDVYPFKDTLDEELQALCTIRTLDDLDLRVRFLVCLLIEDLLQSILPENRVIPYGSCLNGFGWCDSDLDMMLCLNKDPYSLSAIRTPQHSGYVSNFMHLTEVMSSERQLAQRTLTMIASLLDLSPRVGKIIKILNARVPIVRFQNVAANLHCDISFQAVDSIKMTELLYLYSVLDPRVKPLMTGLKQWALCHRLTSSGEQQKPTTIGILTMLIFYLQTRSPPVVPTLRQLQSLAGSSEMFQIDGVVYGLPSNPSCVSKSENTESLESLLHGFFMFYSSFDFATKGISIVEGTTFQKPANSTPVYMENPLCISLNICQNISIQMLQNFTESLSEAARRMDSLSSRFDVDNKRQSESRLSFLFSTGEVSDNTSAGIDVSQLFADNPTDVSTSTVPRSDNETVLRAEENFDLDHAHSRSGRDCLSNIPSKPAGSTQAEKDGSSLRDTENKYSDRSYSNSPKEARDVVSTVPDLDEDVVQSGRSDGKIS